MWAEDLLAAYHDRHPDSTLGEQAAVTSFRAVLAAGETDRMYHYLDLFWPLPNDADGERPSWADVPKERLAERLRAY